MSLVTLWMESLYASFVINDKCVRKQSPFAACKACSEACPIGAVEIGKMSAEIDSTLCNSCGLCLTSCPVMAVEGETPKRVRKENRLLYESTVPPTVKELLIFRTMGIDSVASETGEVNLSWEKAISDANSVFTALQMPPMRIETHIPAESTFTRRELFAKWARDGKKLAAELAPATWRINHQELDLRKYYPEHQFYTLQLQTKSCTLCRTCEFICPRGVIEFTENEMVLHHQDCTSCGLCEDACLEKAVTVKPEVDVKRIDSLYFSQVRCKCCGIGFITFAGETGLNKCMVCSRRDASYLPS